MASYHFGSSRFKICSYINYRKTGRYLTFTHTHTHTYTHREQTKCYKRRLFHKKIVKGRGKSIPVQANCSARRFQEVETPKFRDSRHMQMVRLSVLSNGSFYPLRIYSWYSLLLEAVTVIVRPEELCQRKIPMTPSGNEPATSWLVAHCLNQLRHGVSHTNTVRTINTFTSKIPLLK